ncbi:MAG: SIS domain-containing protein [Phycisphaeraceae bacterium]
MKDLVETLRANLAASAEMHARLTELARPLQQATEMVRDALVGGHKLLCCGNGGSAGDAAHLSSEFVNRYCDDREGFPAMDLSADHNVVTAMVNDYPPQDLFARQVRAFGRQGDVLVAFSSSGKSPNIVNALKEGRRQGLGTIAFLGKGGGLCLGLADVELVVPSAVTARVQEGHLMLYHTLCEAIDEDLIQAGRQRMGGGGTVSLGPKLT